MEGFFIFTKTEDFCLKKISAHRNLADMAGGISNDVEPCGQCGCLALGKGGFRDIAPPVLIRDYYDIKTIFLSLCLK